MSCLRPGAITPEDLVAYVVGEAPATVADHVKSCPQCSAEALTYARADRRLRRSFDRIECPSPLRLGEHALGLILGDERWAIAGHVAECQRCAAELRSLRGFLADEPSAVPSLVDRARRTISAILLPPLAPDRIRGPKPVETRSFRADDVTITIRPRPAARRGRVSIYGLVEGDPDQFAGREARLVVAAGSNVVALIDDLGNFLLEDVAPGVYRLELDLADRLIVVHDVSLG
jgi:anti-sigma factor RsiW